jgi:hypothetical protein
MASELSPSLVIIVHAQQSIQEKHSIQRMPNLFPTETLNLKGFEILLSLITQHSKEAPQDQSIHAIGETNLRLN